MNVITILVVVLLTLVPLPFLPLLRHKPSSKPLLKLKLIVGSMWLIWILFAVLLASFNPRLLYGLAFLAVVATVLLYWRGRESYGRAIGLPGGSLALSQSLLAVADRDYYLKAAETL